MLFVVSEKPLLSPQSIRELRDSRFRLQEILWQSPRFGIDLYQLCIETTHGKKHVRDVDLALAASCQNGPLSLFVPLLTEKCSSKDRIVVYADLAERITGSVPSLVSCIRKGRKYKTVFVVISLPRMVQMYDPAMAESCARRCAVLRDFSKRCPKTLVKWIVCDGEIDKDFLPLETMLQYVFSYEWHRLTQVFLVFDGRFSPHFVGLYKNILENFACEMQPPEYKEEKRLPVSAVCLDGIKPWSFFDLLKNAYSNEGDPYMHFL